MAVRKEEIPHDSRPGQTTNDSNNGVGKYIRYHFRKQRVKLQPTCTKLIALAYISGKLCERVKNCIKLRRSFVYVK